MAESKDFTLCVGQRMYNSQGWLLSISSSVVPFNKTTDSPGTLLPVQTPAWRWNERCEKQQERRRGRGWGWTSVLILLGQYICGHDTRLWPVEHAGLWLCLHWVLVILW